MNIYTLNEGEGVELALVPGADFTSRIQRIDSEDESAEAGGAPIGSFVPREVSHRYADLDAYDVELLARWGIARAVVEPPTVSDVPDSVSAERAQLALDAAGQLDAVEAYFALSSTPRPQKIRWLKTVAIERDTELLAVVAGVLNWTAAQTDNFLRAARDLAL